MAEIGLLDDAARDDVARQVRCLLRIQRSHLVTLRLDRVPAWVLTPHLSLRIVVDGDRAALLTLSSFFVSYDDGKIQSSLVMRWEPEGEEKARAS